MTITNLKQSSPDSKIPRENWAKIEEADNFAKTVKLFRQGKIDPDSFRRFRLQHGAYGTRMTDDYAMDCISEIMIPPDDDIFKNKLQ